MTDPVVEILYQEESGKLVYALRIQGRTFQPKVFLKEDHTVDIEKVHRFEDIAPLTQPDMQKLLVKF